MSYVIVAFGVTSTATPSAVSGSGLDGIPGGTSNVGNIVQLLLVLVVFILVLVAAYFTTRIIGRTSLLQGKTKNISVIEIHKIAPNKHIQIVRLGDSYYAIGVGKDNIQLITKISEDEIILPEEKRAPNISFREAFEKISEKVKNKKNNNPPG